jgi:hypothetical protein
VLEVGFKDAAGIQRWRTVDGGLLAARRLRDELLARRGRGETAAADSRLRFGEAADRWLAGPVLDLRQSTRAKYRVAVDRHLRPRFGGVRLDAITAFPILHQLDAAGRPVPAPAGTLPSMHSFRHTVASRALLAGESVDEVAFLLGHRDATVTRVVYVREVADARRRSMRRSRMVAEYGGVLRAALDGDGSL